VTNKELIKRQINKNRKQIYRNLISLKGWKKQTLDTVFSRGKVSARLAKDLEAVSSINIRDLTLTARQKAASQQIVIRKMKFKMNYSLYKATIIQTMCVLFCLLFCVLFLNHNRYFDKPYQDDTIYPDIAIRLPLPQTEFPKWKLRNRKLKIKK